MCLLFMANSIGAAHNNVGDLRSVALVAIVVVWQVLSDNDLLTDFAAARSIPARTFQKLHRCAAGGDAHPPAAHPSTCMYVCLYHTVKVPSYYL